MKNTNSNIHFTHFSVNFFEHTIIGTKASFNKAGRGQGAIYEELTLLISRHPDFTLAIKEQKVRSNKKKETYTGLTLKFMKDYIATTKSAESDLKEFDRVKAYAKEHDHPIYPFMKKWFLEKYENFNMEEARKAISAYQQSQARNYGEETYTSEAALLLGA